MSCAMTVARLALRPREHAETLDIVDDRVHEEGALRPRLVPLRVHEGGVHVLFCFACDLRRGRRGADQCQRVCDYERGMREQFHITSQLQRSVTGFAEKPFRRVPQNSGFRLLRFALRLQTPQILQKGQVHAGPAPPRPPLPGKLSHFSHIQATSALVAPCALKAEDTLQL